MPYRNVAALVFAVSALLLSPVAHSQLFRAYLESAGSDANPCTLQLPCRLLPAALAAVTDGGEIWMLDSANYNTSAVTINKSVSILAVPGALGSVVAAGTGFQIASSGLTIRLRNLSIVPLLGTNSYSGIYMSGSSDLIVEDSVIAGTGNYAIQVTGTGTLRVTGSTLRDCSLAGVWVDGGGEATIHGSRILASGGAGVGVYLTTAVTSKVSISDSLISGGTHGVLSQVAIAGAVSRVSVTNTTVERMTAYGLFARTEGAGTATLSVSRSLIANNASAVGQFVTAVVYSLGDNHQHGNTSAGAAPTPLAPL
jgi:hypothetical protein